MLLFQGPEFDWLRAQVKGTLWDGRGAPNRAERPTLYPSPLLAYQQAAKTAQAHAIQAGARAAKVVSAGIGPQWEPEAGPVKLPQRYRQENGPPKGAVEDKPPANCTVEEYNNWRALIPNRADRFPYIHQDYPKMVYRGDEEPKRVDNTKDHQRLLKLGWR